MDKSKIKSLKVEINELKQLEKLADDGYFIPRKINELIEANNSIRKILQKLAD